MFMFSCIILIIVCGLYTITIFGTETVHKLYIATGYFSRDEFPLMQFHYYFYEN